MITQNSRADKVVDTPPALTTNAIEARQWLCMVYLRIHSDQLMIWRTARSPAGSSPRSATATPLIDTKPRERLIAAALDDAQVLGRVAGVDEMCTLIAILAAATSALCWALP